MTAAYPRHRKNTASSSRPKTVAAEALIPATAPTTAPATDRRAVAARLGGGTTDPRYLAHDARNWLTVLGVYCDLLRSSGAEPGDHQQWVEDLTHTVDRGRTLVLSLVESVEAPGRAGVPDQKDAGHPETDSSETGRPETDGSRPTSLDVAAVLSRRRTLFERLAGSKIQVEVDAPAGTGHVDMTEGAFERVLENLIGNAIEAMPQGGRLRIGLDRRDRTPSASSGPRAAPTLLLRVQDTGVGIAAERLPHIFDPGVSGKAERAGDTRPHGLGLAIVRELTESARGTVRVQSHPGQGSCFEVELPRQPASDVPPDVPPDMPAVALPDPPPGAPSDRSWS